MLLVSGVLTSHIANLTGIKENKTKSARIIELQNKIWSFGSTSAECTSTRGACCDLVPFLYECTSDLFLAPIVRVVRSIFIPETKTLQRYRKYYIMPKIWYYIVILKWFFDVFFLHVISLSVWIYDRSDDYKY